VNKAKLLLNDVDCKLLLVYGANKGGTINFLPSERMSLCNGKIEIAEVEMTSKIRRRKRERERQVSVRAFAEKMGPARRRGVVYYRPKIMSSNLTVGTLRSFHCARDISRDFNGLRAATDGATSQRSFFFFASLFLPRDGSHRILFCKAVERCQPS